jgi:chromosome segregation protein
VNAPARLVSLRLQGFKSFAEKTLVEFGPGISAVVGPNGSGKSNLADALRWALGEQGRSLRIRKSEDVVWAGSEQRAALGMADVSLSLDNADGLLPVDYGVVELGRRLYRSGENEYQLNRQRVRLRDLVDLLDAANLADNAFLFIGQGMVDQALALRPEERRPLFEEVAGVRRHERRRRKAEEQLAESEANLARVEDILGELRPQARRLAIQAEQQASRATAGVELAAAVVLLAHARWHAAAAEAGSAATARERARAEVDAAIGAVSEAESTAMAIAAELDERARLSGERRAAHEIARSALVALQLREERVSWEVTALERDRVRVETERAAAQADLSVQRQALALPVPGRDLDLQGSLDETERGLAEAHAELTALRAATRAEGEQLAAVRRAAAAREVERDTARRRVPEAERRAADERKRADDLASRRGELEGALRVSERELSASARAEQGAIEGREVRRRALDEREADRTASANRARAASEAAAGARAGLTSLADRLQHEETRAIARLARLRRGRRVDDALVVEPRFRAAVEAALGEAIRGYLVGREVVPELGGERGVLVTEEALSDDDPESGRRLRELAVGSGGGVLGTAVRRDPVGAATVLLRTAVWTPDLRSALALQEEIPTGWQVVVVDGSAVVGPATVRLGPAEGLLDRRAEQVRLTAELERLDADAAAAEAALDDASRMAAEARAADDAARTAQHEASAARARAEQTHRVAARALDAVVRESEWHAAQARRLEADADRARRAVEMPDESVGPPGDEGPASGGAAVSSGDGGANAWEARATELRRRRDRLASEVAEHDRARHEAQARRARAEAAAAIDEERIARAERDAVEVTDRDLALAADRETLGAELARAREVEASARSGLEAILSTEAADRGRLAEAERATALARDRLRAADERLRAAEVADLEARLGLESVREGTLVELAGLGDVGLAALRGDVPTTPDNHGPDTPTGTERDESARDESDENAELEAALLTASARWLEEAPTAEPPGPGRLGQLRRRFHELGSANPYAVEEYAELRARLEDLEGQESDLRTAIAQTRRLIEELSAMVADQFRTTFRALETAFDRRFGQLFGGGYAQLLLTDPADLSATGVEIVARPPGKKAQALAMLSGGERALTAVALLFAMLEVRPVPFCVLDEVDAALDEANVARFTDALRSLADGTQFIVITHNRGTIEQADALYGVTIGSDSVSRVISLRLDEAQALATERRNGDLADAAVG